MISLKSLLISLGIPVATIPDILISGLNLDSRKIKSGDLFFAYKGEKYDGREFISDAIEKGAAAILREEDWLPFSVEWYCKIPIINISNLQQKIGYIAAEFYGNPSEYMKIIGITGTNGKTSCSHLLAAALTHLNCLTGVIGTLGNGLVNATRSGTHTTPDPITLQALLQELHHQQAKAIAMEVSSHALHQGRVNGLHFTLAIFTNLTRDHLDYHGTMAAYCDAKKLLFQQPGLQYAVINADDPVGKKWLSEFASQLNVCGYSIHAEIDWPVKLPMVIANNIKLNDQGIYAHLITPWGEGELTSKLLGLFNLQNLLAVIASLGLFKISLETILLVIAQLNPIPGRMQTLGGGEKPLIVVDYAHTPDALEQVLQALRSHCKGKLFCVFGCGGDRDRGKRPIMAAIAEQYADVVMVTSDNPRFEDAQAIILEVMTGFKNPQTVQTEIDREKAIITIIKQAKVGDVILLAGKGHEDYQIIGDKKLPFSDLEVVESQLLMES